MVKFSKLMALSGSKMLIDAPHPAAIRKGRRELAATAADTLPDPQDGLFESIFQVLSEKNRLDSARCVL